jgi:hypothetical protein
MWDNKLQVVNYIIPTAPDLLYTYIMQFSTLDGSNGGQIIYLSICNDDDTIVIYLHKSRRGSNGGLITKICFFLIINRVS